MPAIGDRMTDKATPPDARMLRDWLGADGYAKWVELEEWIADNYPGTFTPDWIFGGARHGWAKRYKKSRAFCTMVPEYGRLAVVIVFGREDRERAERILPSIGKSLSALYQAAATFHDGKWLKINVPSDAPLDAVVQLLASKRQPRPMQYRPEITT